MKNGQKIALIISVVILMAVFSLKFFSKEDSWNCEDGMWISHGNPSEPAPTTECKETNQQTVDVKVFFINNRLDPEVTCEKVFPVVRKVPKNEDYVTATVLELLKGPTEEEKGNDYSTSINEGVDLREVLITDGVARVDFGYKLDEKVGGSCRVGAIRAQITETLKQFSQIKDVIISVGGNSEEVLQP